MRSRGISWRRSRRLFTLLCVGLALAGAGFPLAARVDGGAAESSASWRGMTLADALARLERQGLRLVFTSRLVRPEMRVGTEPRSSDPRRRLEELLAPHGLAVVERAGGILVVVAAAVHHAPPAPAVRPPPEAPPIPEPIFEEAIVVRSSSISLLDDSPSAPVALSRGEIDALPLLAQDLFRALSLLPGTAGNDYTAQFHVRGGRRDEVQILLDGQELFEAFHLQDFDRALSVVTPAGVGGADLSTGSFAARHGDRMSGVLDLRTTEPAGSRRTELSLDVVSAAATGSGSFGAERGSWLASGRRGSTDLVNRFLGTDRPTFWDLFGKVGYQLGDGQSLRLHGLSASDALETREVDGDDLKNFSTDYDTAYLWLTHQANLSDRVLVETRLSWSELDRSRRGFEADEEKQADVVDLRASEVAGVAQNWSFEAGRSHAFEIGFEARRYRSRFDYRNDLEQVFELSSPELPPRNRLTRFVGTAEGDHLGAFVTDRVTVTGPLTLELGLRYDRHTLTDETLVSPRLNLAWRLDDVSVLRLGWGVYRQSQRPYELAVEDGESSLAKSERSDHWVLGYERAFGGGERAPFSALRVEAYHRQVRDPRRHYESLFEAINTFPEIEPDRAPITPDESLARGLEVVVRGALGEHGRWWANYAWARARDRVGARELPRPIDQTHTLNLYLGTGLGSAWDVSLAWRFHTGWPTTPVGVEARLDDEGEPELVPVLGPIYSERLPSYHRLDLRASREWQKRTGRLTFFLDLQNVYDRRNVAGFDVSFDDESGELGLIPEGWPGIFPSIGVSWEF